MLVIGNDACETCLSSRFIQVTFALHNNHLHNGHAQENWPMANDQHESCRNLIRLEQILDRYKELGVVDDKTNPTIVIESGINKMTKMY